MSLLATSGDARYYGVATPIANPPSTPFQIDTDLNSSPYSDTWTSYALGIFSDDGSRVGAADITLTGQFLQRWSFDGTSFVPSPESTNLTSGDSHLIPGDLLPIPTTENNNTPTFLPVPPDTATRDYGVGTSLKGVWAYLSGSTTPNHPTNFAYVVIPKGSESTLGMQVKVATPQGVGQTLTNVDFGGSFCPLASCESPHAEVYANGSLIPDNRTTTTVATNTDFGLVKQNTAQERTFTIRNTGYSTLTLDQPTFTGPFSIVGSFPTTLERGASAPLTVGLNTATPGSYAGSISFANNDLANNPYNFSLAAAVRAPGLQVLGNGIVIPNNDSTPSGSDSTHFGIVSKNLTNQRTFVIQNDSNSPISVATPIFTGPFSLAGAFPTTIDPNSSVPFNVKLDTSLTGAFNGSIAIDNGDPLNTPYSFALAANVQAATGSLVALATLVKNPPGTPFNAPEAALPADWVAYQISLQALPGNSIASVDVVIDGPLHQRWSDVDFDGVTDQSLNGAASNGRGDSELTAPVGSAFTRAAMELNSKSGSPLTSNPGTTEYGLGGISGAWTLPTPTTIANVAYLVFPKSQLGQMQITINATDASGAPFQTITLSDLFLTRIPEPPSCLLMLAALAVVGTSARYRFA
jgi:hypothetical protein